jgi:putative nucleotidyltransferase with HDIG domain
MSNYYPTRDEAFELLKKYNESESLINHALMVEATMRHFAKKYNEDKEKWGIVGLVHDLDYEKFPEQHCQKTEEILKENNWPEELIRAILSHGYEMVTDIEPISLMEKTLYATDELTGLVYTTALVRPSKSLDDMKVKSVKKKWNDKKFAAGVDRTIIEKGAAMLEIEIPVLIGETIEGMKAVAEKIGLNKLAV